MIKSTIILDSINKSNIRLTTFELVLPKQLLAQLNTHRTLSKNAASSRAIPTKTFKQSIMYEPVLPVWTYNKPGMVGLRVEDENECEEMDRVWLETRDLVILQVDKLVKLGVHKQTANRLLEPWFYAKVVCSATDLDWFFHLRDSGSAQEEIAILARSMKDALSASTPQLLVDRWHIPFILPEELDLPIETQLKISVARCARVSYKTHDNGLLSTIEKDLKLFDQLFSEKHLSPMEHSALAMDTEKKFGNFRGWKQYRFMI